MPGPKGNKIAHQVPALYPITSKPVRTLFASNPPEPASQRQLPTVKRATTIRKAGSASGPASPLLGHRHGLHARAHNFHL